MTVFDRCLTFRPAVTAHNWLLTNSKVAPDSLNQLGLKTDRQMSLQAIQNRRTFLIGQLNNKKLHVTLRCCVPLNGFIVDRLSLRARNIHLSAR